MALSSSTRRHDPRRGTTLPEAALVLALLGVLLSAATPGVRQLLDRSAVVSAREEILGLVHRGRALAPASGGAALRLHRETALVELLDGSGTPVAALDLGARGIVLGMSGAGEAVELRWNALGWGIVTSRTVRLSRGGAEARLVVSSRGRASRR